MLVCKVAIALDLAVSAGTTVKTDATVNFMDLRSSGSKLGFSFPTKTLMFYLEDLLDVK